MLLRHQAAIPGIQEEEKVRPKMLKDLGSGVSREVN